MKPRAEFPPAPYETFAAEYARDLRGGDHSFLLLSAGGPADAGRRNFAGVRPSAVLTARGDRCLLRRAGRRPLRFRLDPLEALAREAGERMPEKADPDAPGTPLAAGYLSYDLPFAGRARGAAPGGAAPEGEPPDLYFAFYDQAAIRDEADITATAAGASPDLGVYPVAGPLVTLPERDAYLRGVRRIKEYIAAGDVYQANYCRRFEAPLAGDPLPLFLEMVRACPVPFAAWLEGEDPGCGPFQVLSASPERLLLLEGGRAETRPIKGTRPRSEDPAEDARLAAELATDAKERAEHVMIVDLERNDLGRFAETGSVRVRELARTESYAALRHLVSIVEGRPRPGAGLAEILRAVFPGGSITGAPKIRAMELIAGLEPFRRGVFTGAVGYIAPGRVDLNVAIRTAVRCGGRIVYHAGGGIVADSDPEREFAETELKALAFRRALERAAAPTRLRKEGGA